MGEEDRWAKLEEIVRRVVREEVSALRKKERTKIRLVNGRWEGISPDMKQALVDAYPAVDVDKELKEMVAWIFSNPNDAPRSDYGKFINTWLKRHQDRHSIRSIPTSRAENAPNLCAYCLRPAQGSTNGYRWCGEHSQMAMDGVRPGKMPGVMPKAVAGAD